MLKIKNLKVKFENEYVLNGINLELQKGEVLSVIGESGTGKTTLALTIMGLCSGKTEGNIIFKDRDILLISEEEKRKLRWNKISIVFQDIASALNPVMKISDQIIEPMLEHKKYTKKEALIRAHDLLRKVGLNTKYVDAYPHQMSGGEKQRALIAMSLANDPELLILDEPTSALDPITRAEILNLLTLLAKNRTIILVTHDISVAYKMAGKSAIVYSGRIMEFGMTQEILKNPRHPYTRGLIRSYPNITTTKDLQGIPGRNIKSKKGCPFYTRCTQKINICENEVPKLVEHNGRKISCHRRGVTKILSTKKLVKKYKSIRNNEKFTALKNADLELYNGETLAIVGESGSGKTTLAKCIMGLEINESGNIYFEDKLVKKRSKNFYKSTQIIFQNPHECISHRLNILDAVTEPLKVQKIGSKKERLEKAKKVLSDVELPYNNNFLSKYTHNLSGGEVQRVAIARALILEPRLLICDEPTSALDASVQAKITKLLLNLQEKKGLSIIFITHDLALARKISDNVIVMLAGEIIEAGPTYEVFTNPKHPYTKDLLKVAPDFTFKIPNLKKVINEKVGACPYHNRCIEAQEMCTIEEPKFFVDGLRKVKCHLYNNKYIK